MLCSLFRVWYLEFLKQYLPTMPVKVQNLVPMSHTNRNRTQVSYVQVYMYLSKPRYFGPSNNVSPPFFGYLEFLSCPPSFKSIDISPLVTYR